MRRHTIEGAKKLLRHEVEAGGASAYSAIVEAVSLVAPFDCAAVMGTDPETVLPSDGIFTGLDSRVCQPFWGCETRKSDVLRFVEMAYTRTPVATLSQRLPGRFDESDRYREVYASLALGDELRVAFMSGGACLGVAAFLRADRGRAFSQEEMNAVRQLTEPVVALLRQRALTPPIDAPLSTPVMALVGADATIMGRTPGTDAVMADLQAGAIGATHLPPTLIAPLARLGGEHPASSVTTRVRGSSGTWYRLHAAPMEGQRGVTAISLEPARAENLMSILVRFYGLTPRERDVVTSLVSGRPPKAIAEELQISTHTVRDHIKAIYEKTAVGSFGELQARLFGSSPN